MLQALNDELQSQTLRFCSRDAIGAVICTQIDALLPFARMPFCHVQTQAGGGVCAVLSFVDGVVNLLVREEAGAVDWDELHAFLVFLGPRRVFTSADTAVQLGLAAESAGVVLRYENPASNALPQAEPLNTEELREVYGVIYGREAAVARGEAFGEWYTDVSHRLRHGLARGFVVREAGGIVSAALTTGETADCAVIGSVTTLPAARGRGYASACVAALTQCLAAQGRDVLLFCADDGPLELYGRLGFLPCARWVMAAVI